MDSKLKAYYDSVGDFEQRLIDWCCIDNKYCPEEYFFIYVITKRKIIIRKISARTIMAIELINTLI